MELYLLQTDECYRLHTVESSLGNGMSIDDKLDGNSYDSVTKELIEQVSDHDLKVHYSHVLDKEEAAAVYADMTSTGMFKHACYAAVGAIAFTLSLPILLPTGLSIFFGGFTAYHYLKLRKSKTFKNAELVSSREATALEDILNRDHNGDRTDELAKGVGSGYT